MTKIIFLGTGGDNQVISKCLRNSAGIIIQDGDIQLHIDPGPNSLLMAKNNDVNIRATTAIICTSPKLSHSNDINALISGMTLNGLDVKGVVVATKTVIEGKDDNQAILLNFFKKCVEKVLVAEPEKKIGIENIDIQFAFAEDYCDTVGMKIFMPDLVIGYTSDTAYSEKIAKQYEGCDVLILNIQNPFGVKSEHTMSSDDGVKFIEKIKPQLTVITHFGKEMLDRDPLLEARRMHTATGCQVMAVSDGQMIQPTSSYSARSKQKRLKNFTS